MLDDLRDETVRERLRAIWTAPASLDPAAETARVTREIADLLATVARRIEKRGHNAEATSSFLMRILITMFAGTATSSPREALSRCSRTSAPTPSISNGNCRRCGQRWIRVTSRPPSASH